MGSTQSQAAQVAADKSLMDGVDEFFAPTNVTIVVAGVSMDSAAVKAALQSRVTARNARTTAKAAFSNAVTSCDTVLSSTQPVVDAVKQIAVIMYANQPATLTVFGLSPKKKPAPMTVEEKAERAAKAKATRIARNTMGPKAKAKVKGTVASSASPAETASPQASTPVVTPSGAAAGPTTTHS